MVSLECSTLSDFWTSYNDRELYANTKFDNYYDIERNADTKFWIAYFDKEQAEKEKAINDIYDIKQEDENYRLKSIEDDAARKLKEKEEKEEEEQKAKQRKEKEEEKQKANQIKEKEFQDKWKREIEQTERRKNELNAKSCSIM